ncbi:glutathione S-transferase, partial [Escherichia coli]
WSTSKTPSYTKSVSWQHHLTAEPYAFGEQLTLVDCYLCTMRTWGPGHEWFQDNAQNISAIADAVCQLPKLQEVLKRNEII